MADWKFGSALKYGAHAIEKRIDSVKRVTKRKFNLLDPICIMPYDGYGNQDRWYLRGRVLEELGIPEPSEDASWWQNARSMTRRFTSAEIPYVRVRATVDDQSWEVQTDEEGYFHFELQPNRFRVDKLWHPVHLEVLDQVVKGQGAVNATGEIAVAPPRAEYGVISDIDDTVLHSRATDLFRLVRLTMLHNSRTRVVLPGVPAFYQSLRRGASGNAANPFFYVSSSAWNLYDAMQDFLSYHELPRGPILLRDLGIDKTKFIKTGHRHKLDKICQILETIDSLPFVLIGDAGQKDPQLYTEVVKRFPGRVKAIYIRQVSWKDRRSTIESLAEEMKQASPDVELRLIEDTAAAAEHAAQLKLIDPASVGEVAEACAAAQES
ncbi:DUF2183 domain-containing protein [Roseiconus nitratireducens]|uniref:DUF2183 domain-containing protein n=1 Tax=Roseiconus nitratireducens TaxID=2605748 RepID=A0A5M6D2W1_9BACT|nr:phosphatase domain-containing protein [Roseiconus nitratireducens]KAA5541834.1 DUF2183 domain-containing protein [Roseiconus nitratireducens]